MGHPVSQKSGSAIPGLSDNREWNTPNLKNPGPEGQLGMGHRVRDTPCPKNPDPEGHRECDTGKGTPLSRHSGSQSQFGVNPPFLGIPITLWMRISHPTDPERAPNPAGNVPTPTGT